jgi:hypothetical protein
MSVRQRLNEITSLPIEDNAHSQDMSSVILALTQEVMTTKKWMWTLPSYYGDEMDLGMKE